MIKTLRQDLLLYIITYGMYDDLHPGSRSEAGHISIETASNEAGMNIMYRTGEPIWMKNLRY